MIRERALNSQFLVIDTMLPENLHEILRRLDDNKKEEIVKALSTVFDDLKEENKEADETIANLEEKVFVLENKIEDLEYEIGTLKEEAQDFADVADQQS